MNTSSCIYLEWHPDHKVCSQSMLMSNKSTNSCFIHFCFALHIHYYQIISHTKRSSTFPVPFLPNIFTQRFRVGRYKLAFMRHPSNLQMTEIEVEMSGQKMIWWVHLENKSLNNIHNYVVKRTTINGTTE